MKKLFCICLILMAGLFQAGMIFAPLALFSIGCKNPNQSAYRVVGSAQVSADVAMRAWGTWVSKNHPAVETELKVKAAFDKYRASMIVLADAGAALALVEKQGLDSTVPRSKLDIALAAAASALGDLTAIIQTFGVKL